METMPPRHTPEQKTVALETLRDTGGDINQTHLKTGIPHRTLYNWRHELWQSWRRQTPSPTSPKPLPEFEDNLAALDFIREQLMAELLNIANNFQAEMAYMPPAQRVMLISQLMDRFLKLDEYINAHAEEEIIHVHEYEYSVAHPVKKNPPRHTSESDEEEEPYPRALLWNKNLNDPSDDNPPEHSLN